MKSKKFYAGILSTLLASSVVLGGCAAGDEKDKADSGDKVTVDVFQFKVEFKNQFEELVKKYEDENPGVDINVKTVGGGNDYGASLKSAFSAGDEPDIFNVGGPSDVEDYREWLADMSETKAAQAALEGTLDSVKDGEETLGLPFNQEGYGYIYNKKVFKDAGIDPAAIKTYEDLEKAVKTLDSKKKELGLDAVFALAAKETWVIGNHLANVYMAPDFNHSVLEAFNAKSAPFTKSEELKRMLDLQAKYSVQPVLSLDYSQQVEQLFSLGKVAMIQQGNWTYNSILDIDPEHAENNIGMIPIPVEGFEGKLPVGVPMYWAVNKKSDEKVVQASKDFLDWMYTSDTGKTAVMEDFKFIPAYEGYDTSKIADPLSQEIYKYSSEGNTIGWVFLGSPIGWQEEVLAVNMQKYLSGEGSWEEAIKTAQESWEKSRQ
ncbi:carbohydrate ABC transporter substrate-binding protein [Bacillus sp. EB106-08-02-XG196]|uniref:ABC transporter substrate-binding protein n=1 Tax=Bacillus sp. EB106-08-02-XG196 TaxID=2737049 RepID=UPI0015C4417D|nr:ABC transporter substrate-binding protein [Bacillus sp. EB106-08-02-XG196]NWQ43136.1 carbohydrate ABC transporter substrate-binding protein [Bacillus sp. EB106-08-02-XG196]